MWHSFLNDNRHFNTVGYWWWLCIDFISCDEEIGIKESYFMHTYCAIFYIKTWKSLLHSCSVMNGTLLTILIFPVINVLLLYFLKDFNWRKFFLFKKKLVCFLNELMKTKYSLIFLIHRFIISFSLLKKHTILFFHLWYFCFMRSYFSITLR